jgi:16S rRNA (guanine527-N7)-methyltransferase
VNVDEFRRRLIDRAAKLSLDVAPPEIDQLQIYYELLARWNRRINLTSLPLEPIGEESLDRLFMEPISAARYVQVASLSWFDLGSGGGSPAVPLRVLRRDARLTMVEARAKKAAFLREVARELKLTDVTVVNMRVEDWTPTPRSAELVTARALRIDAELLSLIRPLLGGAGQLLLFGADQPISSLTDSFRNVRNVVLGPGLTSLTICQ